MLGNDRYYQGAELNNAVNDAKAMAEVFKRLSYDVVDRYDCGMDEYVALLQEFETRIKQYDASIFYFAGHGLQCDGENYLASIDCQVAAPNRYQCSRSCITFTEIMDVLKKNSDKVNIVIIDACRKSFDRGATATFTPVHAPKGTLIAFSTSPNEAAKDAGFEGHSVYTGALLRYIGREWISVEELFKRVRKTVYNLTEGKQTTWEHTSLIGDFFFNSGQLVHSLDLPYDSAVVKDSQFRSTGDEFGQLIEEVKSMNWDQQNAALHRLLGHALSALDKNKSFLLGRNLLQAAAGGSFAANDFFEDLPRRLQRFSQEGENHVLNGILFEIYFDSHGEFRRKNFKKAKFDEIMALRKKSVFASSFDFIRRQLAPYRDFSFWFPETADNVIDVDVVATKQKGNYGWSGEEIYEVISSISALSSDLLPALRQYGITGQNEKALKGAIANHLAAPEELIQIHSNLAIKNLAFPKVEAADEFSFY